MLRQLDFLLNRVSMYRLVTLSLISLWAITFVGSLAGAVAYAPKAILATAIIAIIASYVSNRVFGYLFGIQPHGESSLITALILFFLFSPSTDRQSILAIGMVSVIAMASKYLLVWRSRHLTNPVAIGAVVTSLTGLGYATWWVGTPVLLPFVILFALLILYKTSRLGMGLLFIGVGLVTTVVSMLLRGAPLGLSLSLLGSWPLVFMAGFMLSEPLTLPPKRWQQYLIAVIVALLATIPLRIGTFAISLTLALVIGNLIAAVFARRHGVQLTFKERRALTPTTDEFVFTSKTPLTFEPGQFIELTVPHHSDARGMRRSFSMTSAPGETELRLGVKFYTPSSSFKTALRSLRVGARIATTGFSGGFTLPRDSNIPVLMVAGGIGITPFISQLRTLMKRGELRNIVLIYSVSSPEELAYRDVLEAAGIPVAVITNGTVADLPAHWRQVAKADDVITLIPELAHRRAYISGPPAMIRAYKHLLHGKGVRHIHTDYFTGY